MSYVFTMLGLREIDGGDINGHYAALDDGLLLNRLSYAPTGNGQNAIK